MAKQLEKVDFIVAGTLEQDGTWSIQTTAALSVGLTEYPDFEPKRKGVPMTLPVGQAAVLKTLFVNIIVPLAEAAK